MNHQHRTWAEIDLDALRANASACRDAGPASCGTIFAVVKANAYGHGVSLVAPALRDTVDGFGVANITEARELAALPGCSSSGRRILILSPALPNEREALVAGGFEASVSSVAEAAAFAGIGEKLGVAAKVNAIADTGMGRMGAPGNEFSQLVSWIRARETAGGGIRLTGVATHFPSADEEPEFTRGQIRGFLEVLSALGLDRRPGPTIHLANSAGQLGYRDELAFATAARPGLALYGVSPLPEFQSLLAPVMTWKTRVALVRQLPAGATIGYGRTFTAQRPIRVATLAVGYADGYPRSVSNRGAVVLIGGQRCPLLGRVTMDQIMVEVADDSTVVPGDLATLIGRDGDEAVSARELAEKAGTIPWEIFTGIGPRVARMTAAGK